MHPDVYHPEQAAMGQLIGLHVPARTETVTLIAVKKPVEEGDNGTRELLEVTLKDEEAHIDELEAQLDQIKQMGPQNYLVEQIH